MSDLDDFKATYFDECSELLLELEEQFAAIEDGERSPERLNAVFRAIHSIKGGGGAFGFSALVGFAHAYETLLDHVRDGRVEMSPAVTALCIHANDLVADFVNAARAGIELDADFGAAEQVQFDALTSGGATDDAPMEDFDIDFTPVRVELGDEPAQDPALDRFDEAPMGGGETGWEIRFTPHGELYARANDPLLLLRELRALGPTRVSAVIEEIPALADFEPFGAYCSWVVALDAPEVTEAQIAEVFEFVEGICDLTIGRAGGAVPLAVMEPVAEEEEAPLSFAELAAALKPALKAPVAIVPLAQATEAAEGENDRRTGPEDRRGSGVQSIRVDLDKIDRVVNMVGELVITQSMLTQQMDEVLRARYQELVRGLEVLAQTTCGLQDAVMSIRAQPVKTVFSRMPRLVRELAGKTGKKIRLDTVGENTEIDKTVIEQLSDPLTHMVRNSADHGIETPAARLAAGKPETGTVRLSAEQAGGNILIVVEDDGAGINRERVLQVARERGVVGAEQQLSDEQIDQLIFAPGFSTASEVSDISGRGVGMDVVLSNIKKIGGSVHVRSRPGRGTRMTLRLPLTLAVLDVMLVKVAGSPYVIPLSSIVETIQCARASFSRLPGGGQVLQVRGDYVQVIDLAHRFGMAADNATPSRFVVLCEAEGGVKVALEVDDIIGQQQVVIKSLEENFQSIDGIAGGTILGDGNVALIVDVQGLRASTIVHRSAA
jgi:two-component system chemotaxis sensor kinase CheA